MTINKVVNIILNYDDKYNLPFIDNIEMCSEYGEPGYDLDGKKGILLGNWNYLDKTPRIKAKLEEHYQLEWSDEWLVDYSNDKCYRTQADSYNWLPSYIWTEETDLFTIDDLEKEGSIEFLIEDYLINDPTKADIFGIDFSKHGFELKSEEYQSGWYHRNDDPKEIYDRLKDNYDVIFQIGDLGPFHTDFCVWVKEH